MRLLSKCLMRQEPRKRASYGSGSSICGNCRTARTGLARCERLRGCSLEPGGELLDLPLTAGRLRESKHLLERVVRFHVPAAAVQPGDREHLQLARHHILVSLGVMRIRVTDQNA